MATAQAAPEGRTMEWLNYHHLFYFWTVVREGSIAAAARRLRLSQPTVSEQIASLEEVVGEPLVQRGARGIAMTEMGATVHRYADAIFALGRELQDTVRGRPTGRPMRLAVGVADVVPKLVAHRLLAPALALDQEVRVVCYEDKIERLWSELSLHALDLVLADAPVGPSASGPPSGAPLYSHLLGECDVAIFGTRELANGRQRGFPASLDGAPFLLPIAGTALRRSLDQWFEDNHITPRIAGEFQDSALLQAFGQAGVGLFAAPSAVLDEIRSRHGLIVLGRIETIREKYYAISSERKLAHPAVVAISKAARALLLQPADSAARPRRPERRRSGSPERLRDLPSRLGATRPTDAGHGATDGARPARDAMRAV
ncbi:Transcriptional regulator, LysR family protein [Minicystis rosea]|nr:Transcriptional regulator, LysR family protein [Minicystis rosea]